MRENLLLFAFVAAASTASGCEVPTANCRLPEQAEPVPRLQTIVIGEVFTPLVRFSRCGASRLETLPVGLATLSGPLELLPGDTLRVRGTATGVGSITLFDPITTFNSTVIVTIVE
jgi:hypothetical protein